MLARVRSGALMGVDAVVVEVEVDMSLGLPYFNVVGLPEGAVRESKVRVISALKNSGYELPQKRITVNLAPADIRKEGAAFELPIALGALGACSEIEEVALARYLVGGELSLDGGVKPIRGVLPLAVAARDLGFEGVMVPAANANEAALVDRIRVIAVATLREAVEHLQDIAPITAHRPGPVEPGVLRPSELDLSDVRGQSDVKVALQLAAAGGHNLLLCGPPGSGKTMLARRFPTLLPPLEFEEALEVTKIYSVLGLVRGEHALLTQRPFRAPHHTVSDAGLVGGGPLTRPGELSLAHHGVLFLDELPEFRKHVLEVLRQPLEEGRIHLARATHHVTYPCRVMLVAAMNPCPCGWNGVEAGRCVCLPAIAAEYRSRVSGPLLDRIDIAMQTRPVDPDQLIGPLAMDPPSAHYRDRVIQARERQRHRFRSDPGVFCNAQMGPQLMREHCGMSPRARHFLGKAMRSRQLSARAYDRILKLARTAADLEGTERIEDRHLTLAVQCRAVDQRGWTGGSGEPSTRTELVGMLKPASPWR